MTPGRWTPPALIVSLGLVAGLVTTGPGSAVALLSWPGGVSSTVAAAAVDAGPTAAERTAGLVAANTLRDRAQLAGATAVAGVSALAAAETAARLAAEEAARLAAEEAARLAAEEAARAAAAAAALEAERVAAEAAAAARAAAAEATRRAAAAPAARPAATAATAAAAPVAAKAQAQAAPAAPAGNGCDGAPGWEQRRGERALARLGVHPSSVGWSVAFLGARKGVQAMAIGPQKRIEVYVRTCAKMSDDTLLWALAHEMGHAVDISRGSAERRAQWLAVRGVSPREWFGCNRCTDFDTPAGDFAEVFAYARTGLGGHFGSRVAGLPGSAQLAALRPLMAF